MFNVFYRLLIVSSLTVIVFTATIVEECQYFDDEISIPLYTQINECEGSPCPVVKGTNAVLNTTFKTNTYTERLQPGVVVVFSGNVVPFDVSNIDGCDTLVNIRCPLDEGEVVSYIFEMPILEIFPPVRYVPLCEE